jgi:hypothetical protein
MKMKQLEQRFHCLSVQGVDALLPFSFGKDEFAVFQGFQIVRNHALLLLQNPRDSIDAL